MEYLHIEQRSKKDIFELQKFGMNIVTIRFTTNKYFAVSHKIDAVELFAFIIKILDKKIL